MSRKPLVFLGLLAVFSGWACAWLTGVGDRPAEMPDADVGVEAPAPTRIARGTETEPSPTPRPSPSPTPEPLQAFVYPLITPDQRLPSCTSLLQGDLSTVTFPFVVITRLAPPAENTYDLEAELVTPAGSVPADIGGGTLNFIAPYGNGWYIYQFQAYAAFTAYGPQALNLSSGPVRSKPVSIVESAQRGATRTLRYDFGGRHPLVPLCGEGTPEALVQELAPDLAFPADLMVAQVMLRYDSLQEQGTFEATVCNWGGRLFPQAVEVVFEVNGVEHRAQASQDYLLPAQCVQLYPEATFQAFGIQEPGSVQVTVRIVNALDEDPEHNQVLTERLDIPQLSTKPSPQARARFEECMALPNTDAVGCTQVLPHDPLPERREIAKRWRNFTAAGDRGELYLAAWLLGLRLCTSQVQEHLGIPASYEPPAVVARYNQDMGSSWLGAASATIFTGPRKGSQGELMLIEMLGSQGCSQTPYSPGLIHELTHVLLGLYLANDAEQWMEVPDTRSIAMPLLFDEGLAYWMGQQYNVYGLSSWGCTQDGLVFPFVSGEPLELPFMPVDMSAEEGAAWVRRHPQYGELIQVYSSDAVLASQWLLATATCFWDVLVQREGSEVIGRVIANLYANRKNGLYCQYPFVDVALVPAVSETTLRELEQKFGLRRGVEACRY